MTTDAVRTPAGAIDSLDVYQWTFAPPGRP